MAHSALFTTPEGSLSIEKHAEHVYRLASHVGVEGFVERVGSGFIALRGAIYDRAVAVGESTDFDGAAAKLYR